MSELANKAAQEAYVNSLYRMTQEQLIAEVMRVQGAAAELVKAEWERGYRMGHRDGWSMTADGYNACADGRGERISDEEYKSNQDQDLEERLRYNAGLN